MLISHGSSCFLLFVWRGLSGRGKGGRAGLGSVGAQRGRGGGGIMYKGNSRGIKKFQPIQTKTKTKRNQNRTVSTICKREQGHQDFQPIQTKAKPHQPKPNQNRTVPTTCKGKRHQEFQSIQNKAKTKTKPKQTKTDSFHSNLTSSLGRAGHPISERGDSSEHHPRLPISRASGPYPRPRREREGGHLGTRGDIVQAGVFSDPLRGPQGECGRGGYSAGARGGEGEGGGGVCPCVLEVWRFGGLGVCVLCFVFLVFCVCSLLIVYE